MAARTVQTLQCPRCHAPLTAHPLNTHSAHSTESLMRCEGCRGHWLSAKALDEAIHGGHARFTDSPDHGDTPCVVCKDTIMARVTPKGIESIFLDLCKRCGGMWFDAFEFEKVSRLLAREDKAGAPSMPSAPLKSSPPPQPPEPAPQAESARPPLPKDLKEERLSGDFWPDVVRVIQGSFETETLLVLGVTAAIWLVVRVLDFTGSLASALLFMFMLSTLEHTARGFRGVPPMDRFDGWHDLVRVYWRLWVGGGVIFGPELFLALTGSDWMWVGSAWALLMGPALLVVLALNHRLSEMLNPLIYVSVVAKSPVHFGASWLMFGGAVALSSLGAGFGGNLFAVVVVGLVSFFAFWIAFQVLGVFVYAHPER